MERVSIENMLELLIFLNSYAVRYNVWCKNVLDVELKDIHQMIPVGNMTMRWEDYLQLLFCEDVSLQFEYGGKNSVSICFEKAN